MKRIFLLAVFITAFVATASAQGKFGLGIIVGEPTGVSMKLKLSSTSAIDAAAGWSFVKYGSLHLHADYLNEITRLASEVPFYIGIGGRLKTNNNEKHEDTRLGVRVPFGINYEPSSTPVDLFFEVVPVLDLAPSTDLNLNAAIGVRYYFK